MRAEGARMCICSNTWSSQCRTVLTRLGIDEYFDFYIEAQMCIRDRRHEGLAEEGQNGLDACQCGHYLCHRVCNDEQQLSLIHLSLYME